MENIYVLRQSAAPKAGTTITITKTIVVAHADSYAIRDINLNTYVSREGWKWDYTTPAFWPPVAGDMIESNGIEYVALDNNTEMVLQPVNGGRVVFSYDFEEFLKTQPVLIRSSSNR